MAGTVTEIQTITFDDLEQIPVVGDNDLLLVNDSDSNTAKKATKLSLTIDERDARIASDGYLQGQIDALAGTSGTSEKANLSLKGAPNGLAELDANGKVPASQLPSFVDDVIEGYYNDTDGKFYLHYDASTQVYTDEVTPETGKVYTDLRTNLTYRWGGSAFVKIASDLALGETPTTAYRGDRGKTAYDHSQIRGTGTKTVTNPHGLSPADIGLGNVPNVTTNNQTPTYTESQTDEELTSGETLSTAFGKLAKIVKSVIAHIANSTNPHGVTKSQVGLGNVENVTTESVITSGSNNNITSGAVYTGLTGKLDKDGTAVNSQYAQAIGTSSNHPAIGSTKVPVYIDSNGEPKAITSLEVPTIEGNVTMTGKVTHQDDVIINGSADVKEDAVFEKNVSIVGNLSVSGVTTVAEQESAIASDYLITRLNNLSGLAQGSHSGLAVNNYQNGKMATISADHEGTWRVADSATDTATTYTNISLFNGTYYEGLTHTETTGPTHIITNKQSLTLDNTVWYNGYYYYYNSDWKQIMSVTGGAFVFSAPITDTGLIEALEALTKETLLYYITVTDNYIDEQQNQPLLTRAEVTDLGNNHLLKWDSVHKKAVSAGAIVDTVTSGNMQSVSSNAVAKHVNFRYHDDESQDVDANTLTVPGVYSVHITDPTNQHVGVVETNGWCVIYVTRVDNNVNYVQQQLVDWFGHKWTRFSQAGTWSSWLSNFNYDSYNSGTVDANTLTTPGVYSINTPAGSESQNHVPTAGWCVIYVSRFDNNPNAVQQTLIDFECGIWRRLGNSPWGEWNRDVIHKNISIAVESGVTLPSMFSALSYQLNHTDFSFLLAHPWQTATGGYELQGYYWGEYTATHTDNNNISVIGVIDYNTKPHHFSAFYEPNVGWSFEIGGQEFVTESNGITLTRDTTSNKKYFMTQYATTTIQTIYDLLNYYGLLGRPMKGIFNWKMGMAHNYQYVPNATIDVGTGTLNAGQVALFADPRIDAVDGTSSTWWLHWNEGVSAFACNLWGEVGSAECTWCTLEIWT